MENRGVTPDFELEIMPADWRAGRDPQLEKALQLALDALEETKTNAGAETEVSYL
jgi:tricorn protease